MCVCVCVCVYWYIILCFCFVRDEHEMISRAIRQQNAHLSNITGPNLCLKQLLEPAKFQCVLFEQTYNTRDDAKR